MWFYLTCFLGIVGEPPGVNKRWSLYVENNEWVGNNRMNSEDAVYDGKLSGMVNNCISEQRDWMEIGCVHRHVRQVTEYSSSRRLNMERKAWVRRGITDDWGQNTSWRTDTATPFTSQEEWSSYSCLDHMQPTHHGLTYSFKQLPAHGINISCLARAPQTSARQWAFPAIGLSTVDIGIPAKRNFPKDAMIHLT